MSDYEHEHAGIWGTSSASWTCASCGTELFTPSDYELRDGEEICNDCQDD